MGRNSNSEVIGRKSQGWLKRGRARGQRNALRWRLGTKLLTHQTLCLLPDCSRKTHIYHTDFSPSHLLPHPLPPSCLLLCLSLFSRFFFRCTFLSLLFPSHLHLLHPFLQPFYPIFPSSNHPSIYCISLFLSVLCSHNLKMLLGPQCFASLLSTMINSESVVFCFRQKCCLIVPPTDLPNWAIHIHTVGCSQWWPFWGRGPSAAQECGHVTVDRWVGRREW